jgi:citronellol/citronellal dehydrogenase
VGNRHPRTLKDRVVVVTGASRGIGAAIAVWAAADGAAVGLLAKTETPNPKIKGTPNFSLPTSPLPPASREYVQ